jgi:hypothetical protein
MKKRVGLGLAMGAAVLAVGLGLWGRFVTATPDLSLSKTSDAGLYQVDFSPKSLPFHREIFHPWIVTLRSRSGEPVENARLTFGGGMPGHGHGLPTQPRQTGSGAGGIYEIDGFKFSMAGHWVIDIEIEAPAGADHVVFELQL